MLIVVRQKALRAVQWAARVGVARNRERKGAAQREVLQKMRYQSGVRKTIWRAMDKYPGRSAR